MCDAPVSHRALMSAPHRQRALSCETVARSRIVYDEVILPDISPHFLSIVREKGARLTGPRVYMLEHVGACAKLRRRVCN